MAASRCNDAHTPTLSAIDARGLAVRSIAYCRHLQNPSFERRITRNHFDAQGRLVACRDPRLWMTAPRPNHATVYGLQGKPLSTDSVDAGWQLSLLEQSGATRSFWDQRGSQRHTEFDERLRPIAVIEWLEQQAPRMSERFVYAGGSDDFSTRNQCGQLIRHDHPAGSRRLCEFGVAGGLLSEQTRFSRDLELPDWSHAGADAWLEDEVFETTRQHGPLGQLCSQTDARANVTFFDHDRAGQIREVRLQRGGSCAVPQRLVDEIHYDAVGRSISERAGNGVTTTARYSAEDGCLLQLQCVDAERISLQDFHYHYDPVGNITRIEDKAQRPRYQGNQRIDPVSRYGYDSLYQLIEATGSEVSQPCYGPQLPAWQITPLDPNQLRNYTQTFIYDAAGNLQTRHHSGADNFEMFTASDSNRSVVEKGSLAEGFDGNGNQLELLRGQQMSWDVRNQLSSVTQVHRADAADDIECYRYDAPGHRLRKVRLAHAAHRTLQAEVRYLPGLEIHRDAEAGDVRHVIGVAAGRSHVRVLHWVRQAPRGVRDQPLRYCLSDHLNSSTLELDEQGAVLTREMYYPFGGTALWAGNSEVEATYKTIRYSARERDATGLYHYGYRYYAPWLQRWMSPDPAGLADGINLYAMLVNNPINWVDAEGLEAVPTVAHFFWGGRHINPVSLGNVLTFRMHNPEYTMNVWVDKPSHIFKTLSLMEDGDNPVHRRLARQFGRDLLVRGTDELFDELATTFSPAHKVQALFHRELNGPYRNPAAASDLVKLTATYVHGGLHMDVDVAVRSSVGVLEAPDGFLAYVTDQQKVSNAIVAAPAGSSMVKVFLTEIVRSYDKHDEESWAKKRHHKFWRSEDTLYWTGPGLIMEAVLDKQLSVAQHMVSYRVPSIRGGGIIDDKGHASALLDRGIRPGVAAIGNWPKIRPGRRASV
ncbi:RHS repeat-associated core domain-containing protein [Pseudomonas sp. MYb118]|uniref:RHS repeat-associated core domain-containing protein n=1 Tax=Pseudomonas sp. MYb118 TaxID=1848720 RepID=UPI0034CDE33D